MVITQIQYGENKKYQVYLNDEIDFIGEEPVLDYSLIKKDE